ncbi:DMT family transporter [Rhodovulum sp. DZ06]|uniref:DMT family transporter n=1 Tax=Rhodovulum sp. DZ06 TaxID=3425126 RepID=UPI003D340C95
MTPAASPADPRWARAAGLMLVCCAMMSVVGLLAKALGQGIGGPPLHPMQITAARFAFAAVAFACGFAVIRPGFRGTPWGFHAFRSSVGMLGFVCLFGAVTQMPLTEATAISLLAPFVTLILAIPILGESVGPWRWSAAAASFAGAMLIIRPGSEAFHPAAILALGAAFFQGLEATLVKRLSRGEPISRILLLNSGFAAIISCLIAAAFFWTPPSATQWAMMVGLGVCMATAASCFTVAFKMVDASSLMPLVYFALVFTAFYDVVLFEVIPPTLTVAGIAVIGAAAVVMAWRERRAHMHAPAARTA